MRKIGKFALIIISLIVFSSCSTDEIEPDIQLIESIESFAKSTDCDIEGSSIVSPGSTVTYTYTSNLSPNTITWSILSGNISIISGQGTNTVTLSFASNFNGGSILADGINGVIHCSESFSISACTPPTYVEIDQISGACMGDVFTFTANPNGSTDNGLYQWSVFQGATILSGQGTPTITVASPSSSGFLIRVTHVNSCMSTQVTGANLAEFSDSCGGGLGGGF